jgi:hypothetical protein
MLTAISPTIELNRRKNAEKLRRLADQIENGGMLIAVIRFLVKELGNGEAKSVRDIIGKAKGLTKGSKLHWQSYRRAARIALGIRYNHAAQSYRLPLNHWPRLINVGVLPANREKFERLNFQLIIDEEILTFAKENPVLDRVKRLLNKNDLLERSGATENLFMGPSLIVDDAQTKNLFNPPAMDIDAQEQREAQKRSWFYQHGIELD